MRWTYPQAPGQLPTVSVTKIRAADVRSHFPEGTRFVSPEERREQIGIRQAHVQRRYRQY